MPPLTPRPRVPAGCEALIQRLTHETESPSPTVCTTSGP